jgi:hypothetical protein
MSSINLMDHTTVAKSVYATRLNVIPQLQSDPGVFTFNLTWDEIKKLKRKQMFWFVIYLVLVIDAACLVYWDSHVFV